MRKILTYSQPFSTIRIAYKYQTTLHRSSYDVFNISAIYNHGISFEKKIVGNV